MPSATNSLVPAELTRRHRAPEAFAEIEDDFPALREKYLDDILPEAYAS